MKRLMCRAAILLISLLSMFAVAGEAGQIQGTRNPASPVLALAAEAEEIALTKGLAVGLIGLYGRSAVPADLMAWQMATGSMGVAREGAVVGKSAKGEEQVWSRVEANKEGWIENSALSGGYLQVVVESARVRTMVLEATG
jgi:hypothetical protein